MKKRPLPMTVMMISYGLFALAIIVMMVNMNRIKALNYVSIAIAAIALAVHMRLFVCPHCGKRLGRSREPLCPHCGKNIHKRPEELPPEEAGEAAETETDEAPVESDSPEFPDGEARSGE